MLAAVLSLLVPKCSAADWSLWNDNGEPGFCTRHIGLGVLFSFSLLLLSLGFAVRTARREDAIAAKLAAGASPSDNSSNALARGYVGSRLEVLLDVLKVPFVAFLAVAHYALYQHIARSSTDHHRNPDHRDIWLATEAIQIAIWIAAFLAALIQVVRRVARSGVALGLQLAPLYLLSPLFVLPDVYHHFLKHDVPETLSLHDKIVLSILAGSVALFTLTIFTDRSSRPVKSNDGFERSYETYCSIFSAATFNWVTPTIRLGNKKRLDPEDLDILPTGDQARIAYDRFKAEEREDRSLLKNIFWYHRELVLYQFMYVILCSAFRFAGPLCLNMIVQYFQNGRTDNKIVAYLWAVGIFVGPVISSLGHQKQAWIGRHFGFRLKGILSQMVVEKTLKLPYQVPADDAPADDTGSNTQTDGKRDAKEQSPEEEEAEMRRKTATAGKVLNLLTTDIQNITNICGHIALLYGLPIQIAICFYLLYSLLGVSVFIGLAAGCIAVVPGSYVAKKLFAFYDLIQVQNDKRVNAINELFQSIRIVKMFAWSDRFIKKIDTLREEQINVYYRMFFYEMSSSMLMTVQPVITILVTFFTYTAVFGHTLTPAVAFTSLSILRVIQEEMGGFPGLVSWIISGKTSLNRVDDFMKAEEVEELVLRIARSEAAEAANQITAEPSNLGFVNASFQWGRVVDESESEVDADATETDALVPARPQPRSDISSSASSVTNVSHKAPFKLSNLNARFPTGKLSVIAGNTGQGKTSLLLALLGEMTRIEGDIVLPTTDGNTIKDVSYVAQTAWLRNATIRNNIVFGEPYDEERYRAVLHACALNPDLRVLPAGSETEVGEKGVTLSGGQKQRLSLARAVYSRTSTVLLDDCLSAVDSDTAKHIFKECILGPLMKDRTVVLVTHHVSLVLGAAAHVAVIHEGTVVAQGKPADVVARGYVKDVSEADLREARELAEKTSTSHNDHSAATATNVEQGKLVEEEEREVGSVGWAVYKAFGDASGGNVFWALLVFVCVGFRMSTVLQDWWLRIWSSSYDTSSNASIAATTVFGIADAALTLGATSFTGFASADSRLSAMSVDMISAVPVNGTASSSITESDSGIISFAALFGPEPTIPAHSLYYYLSWFMFFGLLKIVVSIIMQFFTLWSSIKLGRTVHAALLRRLVNATPRFFDRTPLGRIITRFSSDMKALDQEAMVWMLHFLSCATNAILVCVVISTTVPAFVLPGILVSLSGYVIMVYYLNASRDIKRIESTANAPLLSLYGELTSGVTTIRAYGVVSRFRDEGDKYVDGYNRAFYMTWAANRWLCFLMDVLGASVSLVSAVLILYNAKDYTAASAGFTLSYALFFSQAALWVPRSYGELELTMNSMERIEQYMKVEQEALAIIPNCRPPASWPHQGEVVVRSLHARYAPEAPQVIKGISFSTRPGERIGIVGRTGAGKSSLGLLLLRMLEAESGSIEIDGIDISKIGLQDLRKNVVIIPQDPVLFNGTIRSNLDPFDEHDDAVLWEALRRAHLLGDDAFEIIASNGGGNTTTTTSTTATATATPTNSSSDTDDSLPAVKPATSVELRNSAVFTSLNAPVQEGGSNLSVGQHQLVALARALARSPRVLLLDEASSNVDFETDAKIQATIRESFASSTLLTVAHRLRTVIDYDRILVLEKGQVAEFDTPASLIDRDGSIFRSMCQQTGEFDTLRDIAHSKAASH